MQIKIDNELADSVEYKWNIREADNRIAVVVFHRPNHDLWYTSYEILIDSGWTHLPNSSIGHGVDKFKAFLQAEKMHKTWKDSYLIKSYIKRAELPTTDIQILRDLLNGKEKTKK